MVDKALCSGASCLPPHSGSYNHLCPEFIDFFCPCALVHAVILPRVPHPSLLSWSKAQFRGHFLQTCFGLSWAPLPPGFTPLTPAVWVPTSPHGLGLQGCSLIHLVIPAPGTRGSGNVFLKETRTELAGA